MESAIDKIYGVTQSHRLFTNVLTRSQGLWVCKSGSTAAVSKRSKGYKTKGPVSDFCRAIGGCSREAMVLKIRCVNHSKDKHCCHKNHKLELLKLKFAIAQSTI